MMKNKTLRCIVTLLAVTLCLAIFAGKANAIYTLNVRVGASADDAEEHLTEGGSMDLASSDLELGSEGGGLDLQAVGMRFLDIDIPQGATILSTMLQFTVDETDDEPTSLRIFGELTPDASTFSTAAFDISSRTLTSNYVDWNNIPNWDTEDLAGPDQSTPDLTTVIQEIVDQPTWAAGNALSIIIFPNPGGERTAESWDGMPSAAPLLTVQYVPAPSALALTVVGVLGVIRWKRRST